MTSVASRPAEETGSEPGPPAPPDLRQVQILAAVVVVGVVLQPVLAPRLTSPRLPERRHRLRRRGRGRAGASLPGARSGGERSYRRLRPHQRLGQSLAQAHGGGRPRGRPCRRCPTRVRMRIVPIAARLVERGVPAPAALAFPLSAPAINPVVMVSTAVAFPGQPRMVVARGLAGLATSIVVGLAWSRLGPGAWTPPVRAGRTPKATRAATFADTALHDFLHAGGFPRGRGGDRRRAADGGSKSLLDSVAGSGVTAVVVMAAGRAPGGVLRGRRLRGLEPDVVLPHVPAGTPGGRASGGRQAGRPPSRDLRVDGSPLVSHPSRWWWPWAAPWSSGGGCSERGGVHGAGSGGVGPGRAGSPFDDGGGQSRRGPRPRRRPQGFHPSRPARDGSVPRCAVRARVLCRVTGGQGSGFPGIGPGPTASSAAKWSGGSHPDRLCRQAGAGNTDFADVTVRLTGFVVIEPGTKKGFQLTRFRIACCAADARPTQVTVRELDGPVPNGTHGWR